MLKLTHIHLCASRFDVAAWVKTHFNDSESKKLPNGTSSSGQGGLKIAGTSSNSTQQDEGIGIMMVMDKDESTRRQERAAEAELKRQQNALPAWHLKSTITGDLTALGIEETRRAEAAAIAAAAAVGGAGASGGGNDEILRGLGVVGGTSSRAAVAVVATSDVGVERTGHDEKVKVGQDDVDCALFLSSCAFPTYRPFPDRLRPVLCLLSSVNKRLGSSDSDTRFILRIRRLSLHS